MLLVCLSAMFATGCQTLKASNATACAINFDYKDTGVNDQNARALLVHYCICKDKKACE